MKVGFFYQIWHTSQTAIFESLKQFRSVYPDNNLVLLITCVKKNKVEEYDNNFSNIIKKKFNISKIEYFYEEDYRWGYVAEGARDNYLKYTNNWLEKITTIPDDDVDFLVFAAEDWYVFKELPIRYECDVSGKYRSWDEWMNKKITEKFDYNINKDILWFQHGHYYNLNLLREKYTEENKNYITETLKELYPLNFILMPDYILSVWNTHIFKNFYNADYIYEMPSETCDDTPLESFQKTNCYSVHGYKTLYGKPFTEEMKQLGIK